jgi:dienelactone hydrolase
MEFIGEKTTDGVTRREFRLEVAGEAVPGCLWTPEGARGPRPLILHGHGGSQHKKVANITAMARRYALELGCASLAIDGPGHGDRVDRSAPRPPTGERQPRRERDPNVSPKHVAEWKAALSAVQQLDVVGAGGPVGYWGVSMGTRFGVPLVADEPRIGCAIFGLFGVFPGLDDHRAAAERITVPLTFVFQWEDELMTHEQGLALFDAFRSAEKTMHINPGRHVETPMFERDAAVAFFRRHMGTA